MRRVLAPLFAAAFVIAASTAFAQQSQPAPRNCMAEQRSCIVKCGGSNDCIQNCETTGKACKAGKS